jgi:hypothetical protein
MRRRGLLLTVALASVGAMTLAAQQGQPADPKRTPGSRGTQTRIGRRSWPPTARTRRHLLPRAAAVDRPALQPLVVALPGQRVADVPAVARQRRPRLRMSPRQRSRASSRRDNIGR